MCACAQPLPAGRLRPYDGGPSRDRGGGLLGAPMASDLQVHSQMTRGSSTLTKEHGLRDSLPSPAPTSDLET